MTNAVDIIRVGIDQSLTSTGLVTLMGSSISATVIRTSKEEDGTVDKLRRMRYIADQIVEKIDRTRESHPMAEVEIKIEGLGYGSKGDATRDLAGLQYLIIDKVSAAGYNNITIVPPTTLKKFATGKGNAGKDDMLNALNPLAYEAFTSKYKKSSTSKNGGLYDVVDAYFLAYYYEEYEVE